jgi:dihydrofolate reductase
VAGLYRRADVKHVWPFQDVIWDSISLAQTLMTAGVVDEYRLVICPLVLGSGRPLFRDTVASAA